MSTRANIARKNTDGSFDVIYTHWDGYPEHHAPILLSHYSTDQRVQMLLELGSLSILAEKIGEKHDFNDHSHDDTWCMAYGRDRGEKGQEFTHYKDGAAFGKALEQAWTEWIYVWVVAEQRWHYTNNPADTWFKCCPKTQQAMRLLADWEENEKPTVAAVSPRFAA